MNLNEKIKELRELSGMTQVELGEAVGVSEKVISKWECGETRPAAETLPAIADVFGVNIDDLFERVHNCRRDLLANLREYMLDTPVEEVFDRMQEVVAHMLLGAQMRQNRDMGCYTPEIVEEIDGDLLELIENADERPQIFCRNKIEALTNVCNDQLKFAVLQDYPEDMFMNILERYQLYRPVFTFLGMDGADTLLKAIYSGTLPAEVTVEYACSLTGAPVETIQAFFKLAKAQKCTAVLHGKEISFYRWCLYAGTNLQAVIGAAYLITENWGGHR